jgi:N-acetylneuraminic acid mutarotase
MTPRNKTGTPSETYSIADCARFDPDTRKWEQLPPLPEPRSSHDVVVIGSKLIVVGGWALKGPAATQWADTLQTMDLSAGKLEWKSVKQPFRRRALIAMAHGGKMYVLGGFGENAQVVREVAIYDPAADLWTKGPDLPGSDIDAFGPASCVHEGSLYVSLGSGSLYRLDESRQVWEKTGAATPRLAHRLASAGNSIVVIGGASKGRNSDLIESVIPAHP